MPSASVLECALGNGTCCANARGLARDSLCGPDTLCGSAGGQPQPRSASALYRRRAIDNYITCVLRCISCLLFAIQYGALCWPINWITGLWQNPICGWLAGCEQRSPCCGASLCAKHVVCFICIARSQQNLFPLGRFA